MSSHDDIAAAEAAIAAHRARLAEAWTESRSAARRSVTSPAALASAVGIGFLLERRTSRPRGERKAKPLQNSSAAGFWGALTGIGLALVRDQAKNVGSDFLKDLVMRRPDVKPAAERAAEEAAVAAAARPAAQNVEARREATAANVASREAAHATTAANEARAAADRARAGGV